MSPRTAKPPRVPESAVLRACLKYLSARGIEAWRNNKGAGTFRNKSGGERFMRFGGPDGAPDIFGYLSDGRALFVECKASDGKLRPEQAEFLDRARRSGCVCIVARSVDDLAEGLREAQAAISQPVPMRGKAFAAGARK